MIYTWIDFSWSIWVKINRALGQNCKRSVQCVLHLFNEWLLAANQNAKLYLYCRKGKKIYRISLKSIRINYRFLKNNLPKGAIFLLYKLNSCRGNYSREERFQGEILFKEIQYASFDCFAWPTQTQLKTCNFCSSFHAALLCCFG